MMRGEKRKEKKERKKEKESVCVCVRKGYFFKPHHFIIKEGCYNYSSVLQEVEPMVDTPHSLLAPVYQSITASFHPGGLRGKRHREVVFFGSAAMELCLLELAFRSRPEERSSSVSVVHGHRSFPHPCRIHFHSMRIQARLGIVVPYGFGI